MTKTLILMRHAKSSWDSDVLSDHDRPLNTRGRQSATALGRWMREAGWLPDQVLCSSSVRTRETLSHLEITAPTEFATTLYNAGAGTMRVVLEMAVGQSVLLIGHNPGIAEFASRLAAAPPDHPRFDDYPTGATTVMRFDIDDWDKVDWHMGEVCNFVIPRELPDA